jgi:hypothetical protein
MQSTLTGASTWTLRLIRNSRMVAPHVAKNDVFSYKAQLNHDKALATNLDGFHIHFLPIGAVTAGQIIAIDYAWGWLTANDTFPDTLPNTGTATYTLQDGDQYKYLIKPIITDLAYPTGEGYSSEFFIVCQRRNDGQDTYAGEIALLDGDVHYQANRVGSYNEYTD